jgi:hypothetical protein
MKEYLLYYSYFMLAITLFITKFEVTITLIL